MASSSKDGGEAMKDPKFAAFYEELKKVTKYLGNPEITPLVSARRGGEQDVQRAADREASEAWLYLQVCPAENLAITVCIETMWQVLLIP